MRSFFRVLRAALSAYRVDPTACVLSVVTVVVCAARFFLVFFSAQGRCDLRPLFSAVPQVSVLTVPLLVFRQRALITDDSVPAAPFTRLIAVACAGFCAFALPLLLLLVVPACAQSFGDVAPGQLVAGYLGVLLYGFAACSLCVALFALCAENSGTAGIIVPLFVSALVLLAANNVHQLPLYVRVGGIPAFLMQKLSFAWHFDAASKGVLDSRDILFYLFASFCLLLLATAGEYRRTGLRISRCAMVALFVLCVCGSVAGARLYVRLDLTEERAFTLSALTRSLLSELDEPLRITYYRSRELRRLYPQTNDVAEFLALYARQSSRVSVRLVTAEGEALREVQSLGVQGRQLRSVASGRTEFLTVYSAVSLEYLGRELVLPFVLSTRTLEYDVTRRVQELIAEVVRPVYVVVGNDRVDDYGYVAPYLENLGFLPQMLAPSALSGLSDDGELVLLGTGALTADECAAVEALVRRGVPAFIATSPYTVAADDDWSVTRTEGDAALPMLARWGFGFERALVQDIACVPLSLQSGEGSAAEYQRVNYPLWLSLLPQPAAPDGATLFWVSPLVLYDAAEPLLVTTGEAWTQDEGADGAPFVSNPFLLARSAREAGAERRQLVVAATVDGDISGYYERGRSRVRVTVVADQYALSSLMTAYVSTSDAGDFRTFDFVAAQLLRLRGDEELSALLLKKADARPLYKLSADGFADAMRRALALVFGLLPLSIIAAGIALALLRRHKNAG